MKNNKIKAIQNKHDKIIQLLNEYELVKESEKKSYHLLPDKEVNNVDNWSDSYKCECGKGRVNRLLYNIPDYKYILVSLDNHEVVCYGSKQRLKSFLNIRNIKKEHILFDSEVVNW